MKLITPSPNGVTASRRPQSGLSLIELMIAITLGMLVVAALLALFLNITRTNNEMAKSNRQIENGRFAIQLLQNDLVHAGFWGEYVPLFDDLNATATGEVPSEIPDPCVAFSGWNAAYKTNLLGIPAQGYGSTLPTGAGGCETNFSTDRQANTDVLVVRHAQTCLPGDTNCDAYGADQIYLQAALCDVEGSDYRVDTGAGIDADTLHQRDCVGTGIPPALPIASGTPANKRKFVSNIYHVRNYPGTTGDDVPIPTLMRSVFDKDKHLASQPLIEGIEAFRVEFLIDNVHEKAVAACPAAVLNYDESIKRINPLTCLEDADPSKNTLPINRGDGIPDGVCYAGACTVGDLMNLVAVRIHVLSRNLEPTPGYEDSKEYKLGDLTIKASDMTAAQRRYMRHVFSTTVRLNNISGRREVP
jgi:type IV pilus assembly protein PilW